jgi:hypothetical protein
VELRRWLQRHLPLHLVDTWTDIPANAAVLIITCETSRRRYSEVPFVQLGLMIARTSNILLKGSSVTEAFSLDLPPGSDNGTVSARPTSQQRRNVSSHVETKSLCKWPEKRRLPSRFSCSQVIFGVVSLICPLNLLLFCFFPSFLLISARDRDSDDHMSLPHRADSSTTLWRK